MTEPTTERLAKALEQANAPADMIKNARAGYYDDFKSELEMPIFQLVRDLQCAVLPDLARRALNGEFDGTPAESEAWIQEFKEGDAHEANSIAEEVSNH